jgi:hypothetical protein
MGGPGAPDDLTLGHVTQAWLAEAVAPEAQFSGGYYYHQAPAPAHYAVQDHAFQSELFDACARLTGVRLPG